jgi:hypothetical protein
MGNEKKKQMHREGIPSEIFFNKKKKFPNHILTWVFPHQDLPSWVP